MADRMDVGSHLGKVKRGMGKEVRDEQRQEDVLHHAEEFAKERNLDPKWVNEMMQKLMNESEKVQEENIPIVAIQGERGAYSEAAIGKLLQEKAIVLPCETFSEVFDVLKSGEAEYAVLPIENSTEGSVNQVFDLLTENNVNIHKEAFLRVEHYLMVANGTSLASIQEVISHPQALAQCRHYLEQKLPFVKMVPHYDTAGAAKTISQGKSRNVAAIASKIAAKHYGLRILEENIEDNKNNFTRFLLVSKMPVKEPENPKSSIVFSVKHEAGALFKAMESFSKKGINLTKIESRPKKGAPWNYVFYMDFEGDARKGKCAEAMAELGKRASEQRILGVYEKGVMDETVRTG
jgi:chorismate mutase/prephenate dehydratase